EMTGGAGQVTAYDYDLQGNQTGLTDGRQNTTTSAFDSLNRLVEMVDPMSGQTQYAYDALDHVRTVTDGNGNVTTYTYNALGDLLKLESPDTGVTIYTYDDAGNRLSQTDARGVVTEYTYDALNRLIAIHYASDPSHDIAYTYDEGEYGIGRLTRMVDTSGSIEWDYDQQGRVTGKHQTVNIGERAVTLSTTYSYGVAGRLESMTYPSGSVVDYGYANGQLTSLHHDGVTVLSDVTYEPFGPASGWKWRDGSVHTRTYDLDGRLIEHTLAGEARTLEYDLTDNITHIQDTLEEVAYDYDALNRLTAYEPAASANVPPLTEPLFDAPPVVLAQIQTMANESGTAPATSSTPWLTAAVSNVQSDGVQIALERSEVAAGVVALSESFGVVAFASGRSGTFTDDAGETVSFQTQTTSPAVDGWANGCDTVAFTSAFDTPPLVLATKSTRRGGNGGWLRRCALDARGVGLTVDEDRARDNERRHLKEAVSLAAFSNAFHAVFGVGTDAWRLEVAQTTLRGTRKNPVFTPVQFRGRFAQAPIVIVLATNQGRHPSAVRIRNVTATGFEAVPVEPPGNDGRHVAMTVHYLAVTPGVHTLPDATTLEARRIETRAVQHGRGVAGDTAWTDLRFRDRTRPGRPVTALPETYAYDANGNRIERTVGASLDRYTVAQTSNRLLDAEDPGLRPYDYDVNGNTLDDGINSYDYDAQNRLTTLNQGQAEYRFNGNGQRVLKVASDITVFVYDENGQLIGEYDHNGVARQEHLWLDAMPVAVANSDTVYLVHTDHLSTPRAITDNGVIIWQWRSGPFGDVDAQTDPDGDGQHSYYALRFPGQYFDEESGLHYNYFRFYDPRTGRYLRSDPIGFEGGLNTYTYVGANP
ncbi:MAG: RHS repeat-associated core domain-containing protein, partial [Gammaproteobacteria bacterium]